MKHENQEMERLTFVKEQELENAIEIEKRNNAIRLSAIEADLRNAHQSNMTEQLSRMNKELEKDVVTKRSQIRAECEKEFRDRERHIRDEAELETKRLLQDERRKWKSRLNTKEQRLRVELERDREKMVEKIRLEEEATMHACLNKTIREMRRKMEKEKPVVMAGVRKECTEKLGSDMEMKKKVLEEKQKKAVEALKEKLKCEAEEEVKAVAEDLNRELQMQMNNVRAVYTERRQIWLQNIRKEANRNTKQSLDNLRLELEKEKQEIVAKTRDEIVKEKRKRLELEFAAHQKAVDDAIARVKEEMGSISNTERWWQSEVPMVKRLEVISRKLSQMQHENRLLHQELDAKECKMCESLLAENASLLAKSFTKPSSH